MWLWVEGLKILKFIASFYETKQVESPFYRNNTKLSQALFQEPIRNSILGLLSIDSAGRPWQPFRSCWNVNRVEGVLMSSQ